VLSWSDPPAQTRALALIVEDPDAPVGTFTHWLAWNIEPVAGGSPRASRPPPRGATTSGSAAQRTVPAARARLTPRLLPAARARPPAHRRPACRAARARASARRPRARNRRAHGPLRTPSLTAHPSRHGPRGSSGTGASSRPAQTPAQQTSSGASARVACRSPLRFVQPSSQPLGLPDSPRCSLQAEAIARPAAGGRALAARSGVRSACIR
jgi:hypothetical protein